MLVLQGRRRWLYHPRGVQEIRIGCPTCNVTKISWEIVHPYFRGLQLRVSYMVVGGFGVALLVAATPQQVVLGHRIVAREHAVFP